MNPQHAKEIRNRSGARWSAEEVVEEVEDTMSPEGMTAGDTIAAISTAAGTGAIGIVRMSGPEALEISGKVFVSTRGRNPAHTESHRLLYGNAVDPANGRVIDEVLRASVSQLQGGLSTMLREIRSVMVGALAELEARIDFSDEDIEDVDRASVSLALCQAGKGLSSLLETAFLGRMLEKGVRTVIVGKPNVGKSSLLNALLMRERAIVSEHPGTTRDTVEGTLVVGGLPLHLVDTAGMRVSEDLVERLGIERSEEALEGADLILVVIDVSGPLDDEDMDVLGRLKSGRTVIIGNKTDLAGAVGRGRANEEGVGWDESELLEKALQAAGMDVREWPSCLVSARDGEGLEELKDMIERVVLNYTHLTLPT